MRKIHQFYSYCPMFAYLNPWRHHLFLGPLTQKMGAIYRPNRNLSLDKWIRDARIKTDIEVFSRKTGLRESMYFLPKKLANSIV